MEILLDLTNFPQENKDQARIITNILTANLPQSEVFPMLLVQLSSQQSELLDTLLVLLLPDQLCHVAAQELELHCASFFYCKVEVMVQGKPLCSHHKMFD